MGFLKFHPSFSGKRDSGENLKKVLALVLAFACAFTMFAGAAFTDSADIKATEAVDTLTALGVIDGFEDGSFQPNGTVTRAQMAKMIYVARTGSTNADSYKSATTSFTDIGSHWAAGYIKYCQANNIIAGKSATKFVPDATVTGVEAAKMLLVTMGYQPAKCGLTGAGWDQKTIGLASENKLLDDVNADLYSALPRQYAAQIIYNTLNADRVVWSTDANGFDWYTDRGGNRETVGEKYLDLTTYEATLTATGKWGTSKDHMIINTIKKINNNSLSTPAGPKTLDFSEDLSDMMYQRVKVMTGKNDKVLGVYTLDDSVVTANTADVGTDGAKIKIDGTKYSLNGDKVTVYENGANKGQMTASDFKSAYQYTGSVVTFSDAADAGKFDTAVVVKPTVGKVTSVSSASIVAGGKTYKFADDNIVDGLKKDDYAVVVPNLFNDNNDITKADIVEGAYNGVKSHEVRVASNWYKTSEATATLMSGISSGNTVQLFVANGVAFDAKKITGTGSGEPDMALVVDTGSFKQVRVMFADGTVKTVDVDGTNPTAGTLYEYTVKEGKYKFVTPTGNVDYTYVSSAVLNQADGTTAADTTHSVEKFGTNAIDDNAVVFVYSANETDAKKITGKQLKTMKVGSGALVGTAVGYTSKVNGMTKATYVAVKMATGTNLPNNFDTNDNYGYIVKDAYKDGDYSVYKVWTGTETVEVREEVTYNSTETHKDARLKGDVIGYSTIETKEGELPEIKDVTRYSLAVAGTTLKVGGVSGSTSSKVAIDGANEYDLTKDTVILNVNSSEDTKDIGLTGTELFEADDYTVGSATKYVPNALYLLDGDDIEMIVVDANVIKNTYAAKVASIAAGVTVEDRNGDAVEAGDYVVANEVLTVKYTNTTATSRTITLTNAKTADSNDSTTIPVAAGATVNALVYVVANTNVTFAVA